SLLFSSQYVFKSCGLPPANAEKVPLWNWLVAITGSLMWPSSTQPVKSPVSNPPLTITSPGEQVGVGDGVPPPPIVPLIRYTWSGPPAVGTQVSFRVHVGQMPKPPPGFCHAAVLLDCT